MTDITENIVTEAPAATEKKSTAILMQRDHKKGGRGVTKMYVDPAQLADFEKAGWTRV